jgi:uncharacterized DUF497 family protein
MRMRITFDPAKDSANLAKHGVPLALAELLEWECALIWKDERKDYGEDRKNALAPMGSRLYSVAFVDRRNTRRIISLRKANRREVKRYVEND